MKFQLYSTSKPSHGGFASCVCWLSNELVVTCGDDRKLLLWSSTSQNEPIKSVQLPIESYPTSMHAPVGGNSGGVASIDSGSSFSNIKSDQQWTQLIAVGASNGHFYLLPPNWSGGRIEKSSEAHNGAIIVIRWSNDGSTLATGGEDGLIKIWSRAGMLRSTISGNSMPMYALAWSPDNNSLVYSIGNQLTVKSLSPSSRSVDWQAHDGLIISLHWSLVNGFILSASEDARAKMWDSTGKLLFVSAQNSTVPSSVAWAPSGDLFAISTFNTLKLHDSSGACLSVEKLSSEGIHALAWSFDSNQLCCVCSTGQVIFAYVIERALEWGIWQTCQTSKRTIRVTNCTNDLSELLDFRDSITRVSFVYDQLIVLTTSQCFIYQSSNWATPHHFDAKNIDVILIKQSQKYFLLMTTTAANIYSYDGRFIRTLKLTNMRADSVRSEVVSLNSNTFAYREGINLQTIHFNDLDQSKGSTSKERQTNSYRHLLEVTSLKMSPEGNQSDQICAFLDKNSDLYIVATTVGSRGRAQQAYKLSARIRDYIWHSDWNVLVSMHDNQSLTLWLFPNVVLSDSSLLQDVVLTISSDELTSKNSHIVDFTQNQLIIQRVDNVKVYIPVNPFVILLHKLKSTNRWQEAVKMCNFLEKSVNEMESMDRNVCNALWATLAAMTLEAKEFSIAEIAYAAINKLDKVLYLNRIKKLSVAEATAAEFELMCGNIMGAENYFLQKGFVLRTIMLNLELFRWKRALELAEKYNAKFSPILVQSEGITENGESKQNARANLIQIVLACRQNYLRNKRKTETIKEFQILYKEIGELMEWNEVETTLKNNDKLLYSKTL